MTIDQLKNGMNLRENATCIKVFYFKWLQSIDSISESWKFVIKENYENATNLIIHDHHLIKGSRVITLDKLTLTEIYSILILKAQNKPCSNIYFEKPHNDYNID